jgi:hypothetical protein
MTLTCHRVGRELAQDNAPRPRLAAALPTERKRRAIITSLGQFTENTANFAETGRQNTLTASGGLPYSALPNSC